MKKYLIITGLCILHGVHSQNPILEGMGVSDPHVRVFNDTLFLFSGHDDSPDDKTWVMKDWRVFSSTNLVKWTQEIIISPRDNYMDDNSTDCWAGDAAERDGNYYFYFSDQKRSIGVMRSATPGGEYIDAIGKPLVAPMHDPTLFVDDDPNNTPYLVYGDKAGGGYRIARVNENMISLAEIPKGITIQGEAWDRAPHWMDKNYLFKHEDTYYLSWGRDYATSKSIYGPYICAGSFGTGQHLNELAHGSFFWWKGQFYHIWTYYLRSGYKYRTCLISYCHIDEKGRVHTDTKFLDDHLSSGVGQYDASWKRIEAEWYYEKSEDIEKHSTLNGGIELTNVKNGDWIRFANMEFDSSINKVSVCITNSQNKGYIELRSDSLSGQRIGNILVPKLKCEKQSTEFSGAVTQLQGKRDLYLRYVGSDDSQIALDYFSFE